MPGTSEDESHTGGAASELVVHIRPTGGWTSLQLREIWKHRELLYQMTVRDIRTRYKQSIMGKFWVILQPLATMAVYYTIFGVVLRLKTEHVPFPIFLLSGIVIWQLISSTILSVSVSLVANAGLLNKVYFPRLLVPLSRSLGSLVDFAFALLVLIVFMVFSGITPDIKWLAAPAFIAWALLTGLAVGLWLAPLYVRFRDISVSVPIVLQLLMYLSPVFYSPTFVPEKWRDLYFLNPGAGIIQGFRWALLNEDPPLPSCLWGLAAVVVFLIAGLYYFRRREANLSDTL